MISQGDGSIGQLIKDGLCSRCHAAAPPVEVHGHTQCSVCKMVIVDCCQGERADDKEHK